MTQFKYFLKTQLDDEWDLICLHICCLQIALGSLWCMSSPCRNPTAFHQYILFVHMPARCDLQNISVLFPGIHHTINSSFLFLSAVKQLIFTSNSTISMAYYSFTAFSPKRWNSLCYKTFTVDSLYFLKSSNTDLMFPQTSLSRVRPDPEVAEINMAPAFSAVC